MLRDQRGRGSICTSPTAANKTRALAKAGAARGGGNKPEQGDPRAELGGSFHSTPEEMEPVRSLALGVSMSSRVAAGVQLLGRLRGVRFG